MRCLVKKVARPGTFVNYADGKPFEMTADMIREATEGSIRLTELGYRVRCFPDHETNTTHDVLGTWLAFATAPDGSGWAIVRPRDERAAQTLRDADVSIVMDSVDVGDGVVVPLAFARIDGVPNGAIVGLAPFAPLKLARRVRFMGGALSPVQNATKERPMDSEMLNEELPAAAPDASSLSATLARALSLALEGDEQVAAALGGDDVEERLADMVAAIRASLACEPPAAASYAEEVAEGELTDAEIAALPPSMARFGQLFREQSIALARMQEEQLVSLASSSGLPREQTAAVVALARKVQRAGGFQLAREVVERVAAGRGPVKRVAPRPHAHGAAFASRASSTDVERVQAKLLAAGARLAGGKPPAA